MALFASANAVLVIFYGLVGVQGLSLFTGGYLVACEMALLYFTWRRVRPQSGDYLFCAFVLCAVVSFAINGRTTDPRQAVLFAIALAAYPALRGLSFSKPRIQETFVRVTGAIVALGTALTAYATVTQWGGPYVRPFVLGVTDAASTFFLMSCGLLVVAVAAKGLDQRRSLLLSAFIFLPTAVFSASHVRATFIAIIATLALALLLSEQATKIFCGRYRRDFGRYRRRAGSSPFHNQRTGHLSQSREGRVTAGSNVGRSAP